MAQHLVGTVCEVVYGGGVSHRLELLGRDGVTRFWSVAQGEQALGGARTSTRLGDGEHFGHAHVHAGGRDRGGVGVGVGVGGSGRYR